MPSSNCMSSPKASFHETYSNAIPTPLSGPNGGRGCSGDVAGADSREAATGSQPIADDQNEPPVSNSPAFSSPYHPYRIFPFSEYRQYPLESEAQSGWTEPQDQLGSPQHSGGGILQDNAPGGSVGFHGAVYPGAAASSAGYSLAYSQSHRVEHIWENQQRSHYLPPMLEGQDEFNTSSPPSKLGPIILCQYTENSQELLGSAAATRPQTEARLRASSFASNASMPHYHGVDPSSSFLLPPFDRSLSRSPGASSSSLSPISISSGLESLTLTSTAGSNPGDVGTSPGSYMLDELQPEALPQPSTPASSPVECAWPGQVPIASITTRLFEQSISQVGFELSMGQGPREVPGTGPSSRFSTQAQSNFRLLLGPSMQDVLPESWERSGYGTVPGWAPAHSFSLPPLLAETSCPLANSNQLGLTSGNSSAEPSEVSHVYRSDMRSQSSRGKGRARWSLHNHTLTHGNGLDSNEKLKRNAKLMCNNLLHQSIQALEAQELIPRGQALRDVLISILDQCFSSPPTRQQIIDLLFNALPQYVRTRVNRLEVERYYKERVGHILSTPSNKAIFHNRNNRWFLYK